MAVVDVVVENECVRLCQREGPSMTTEEVTSRWAPRRVGDEYGPANGSINGGVAGQLTMNRTPGLFACVGVVCELQLRLSQQMKLD